MDQHGTTIDAVIQQAVTLGEEGFLQRFQGYFLVAMGDLGSIYDDEAGQQTKLETPSSQVIMPDGTLTALRGAPVWSLQKHVEMFPAKIMVGRTPNNDVFIPHPTISKFHAYFAIGPEGPKLIEAGSRNASRINGERVTSELKPKALRSGDTVQFGAACPFLLVDGPGLLDQARRVAQRG